MTRSIPPSHQADLDANTRVTHCPLVPEIALRLLRPDAPWYDAQPGIFDDDGPRPYWAFAWGSGQALARHLLDRPELVRGRSVVEFGAGSGITSIAAAMAGARAVLAIDIDPLAVSAITWNAELNRANVEAVVGGTLPPDGPPHDVLLCSDAFFHWPGNESILFAGSFADVLVALPMRRAFAPGRSVARRQLEELATYEVRTVPEVEIASIRRATVYRLHVTMLDENRPDQSGPEEAGPEQAAR